MHQDTNYGKYSLDPLKDDAALDTEGDGASNNREYRRDTDPSDDDSTPPPILLDPILKLLL